MGKNNKWLHRVYGVGKDPDFRASLANERTALAMIRTALALVATGLAVAALQPYIGSNAAVKAVAVLVAAMGAVVAILAVMRWIEVERAMRLNRPLPAPKVLLPLAFGIVIIGVISIIGLVG